MKRIYYLLLCVALCGCEPNAEQKAKWRNDCASFSNKYEGKEIKKISNTKGGHGNQQVTIHFTDGTNLRFTSQKRSFSVEEGSDE